MGFWTVWELMISLPLLESRWKQIFYCQERNLESLSVTAPLVTLRSSFIWSITVILDWSPQSNGAHTPPYLFGSHKMMLMLLGVTVYGAWGHPQNATQGNVLTSISP